jgi:uncharacterized protein (TIGR00251 family)
VLYRETTRVAIRQVSDGVCLRLKVLPRASRTEVVDIQGDLLRIRLAAPPVDGAANDALVRFLAERVSVPKSAVQIVSGRSGRTKVVIISGAKLEQIRSSLGF